MNNLDFVLPQKLTLEKQTDDYGKFIIEPFEPGYGHTVGNSLRRILLSSLQGSSITACRIKGAMHEYDILKNVKEDVMQIILNLKKIRLKMYASTQEILRIEAKGEKVVCAGDIQPNSNVEILNPSTVLATVNPGTTLEMELEVNRGRGYVTAEQNKRPERPLNTIFIDSLFSPITKVYYEVDNVRVKQRTDYDRLIIEIWTNGSIVPQDALAYSAKIMKDNLGIFLAGEKKEKEEVSTIQVVQEEKLKELLSQPVEILSLSSRPFSCLKATQVTTVGDLVKKKEDELSAIRKLGKRSIGQIKEKLAEHNLTLGMDIK